MKTLLSLSIGLCALAVHGQTPTVGLILNEANPTSGYSLFVTELTKEVYLLDNCGKAVKTWHFNSEPGLTTYLLENGSVLLAGKDSLEIRDWNDNQLWSYATTDNGIRQHHDIQPLPNGNILCIASDPKNPAALLAAGRDTSLITIGFRMDRLVELQPIGAHDAQIVWEWRFWDHLIQDFDSTKANYGIVADHPELIDLNFNHGYNDDWSHLNSVDYDPILDQVLISSRNMGELYMIDHSTTTLEAANHTGGNSGMGGDIIWRWGNPQVYRAGLPIDQKLQYQHDGRIIRDGSVNEGKISVFNNGGDLSGNFSSIGLLEPVRNGYTYSMSGSTYLPSAMSHTWNGDQVNPIINTNKKCGVQYFPNGHKLVCDTQTGRLIELNANDSVIWIYVNPVNSIGIYPQFSTTVPGANAVYRVHKYAENYAPLVGQNLSGSILENENSLSAVCMDFNALEEASFSVVFGNPVVNGTLSWKSDGEVLQAHLFDLQGRRLITENGSNAMNVRNLPSGWYLLHVESALGIAQHRVLVLND